MIKSFKDKETQKIFDLEGSGKLPVEIQKTALRKLKYIHSAGNLTDLRVPPGNRLEKLKGNRSGQYSIRINNQWRICFKWLDNHAYHVEITDYH